MSLQAPPPPPGITPAPAPVTAAPGKWQTGMPAPHPPRLVINGVEGVGKTTLASHAPGAAIIMAAGETGYTTLLGADRVPSIPYMLTSSWQETLATVRSVAKEPGEIKTLVLDALNGFEHQCQSYICDQHYSGDWGEHGFTSFMRGYEQSGKEWLQLLKALDDCHDAGIGIIILSHIHIKAFNNPEGSPYDRYQTDAHQKTWSPTHKWADAVLFMTFKSAVVQDKATKRTHAIPSGGRTRVIHTERTDAYDAKNRYGMPASITIPNDHTASWQAVAQHISYYKNQENTEKKG